MPLTPPQPRIVLGITGGIAAYKCAELVRMVRKAGIDVQVVLTAAGARFITAETLQALSGNPVFVDAWDDRIPNRMAHIELSREAKAILIAPASADFMAKLAHGLADDLLSTLCLARQPTCRLIVAPAMNREMWENPAMQRNLRVLTGDRIEMLGPLDGDQACGETGPGRMMEPAQIVDSLLGFLVQEPKPAQAKSTIRALVTAGPTFEPIDPVRGITNRSSGKMGYAIAEALRDQGIDVCLIIGPTALTPPDRCRIVRVETALEMLAAVKQQIADVELFFSVAAVADYTPVSPLAQKLKKKDAALELALKPTTDILAWVAALPNPPFCVGFAAESENVVEYASKKRQKKKIPMIVANLATAAIGADKNEVTVIDASGMTQIGRADKRIVAGKIVDHAVNLYQQMAKSSKTSATSRLRSPNSKTSGKRR